MPGVICRIALICVVCAHCVAARSETAVWNGSSGNWSDASRWSTDPEIPNNGATTYDVVLSGGAVTQDVAGGATIDNLTWSGGTISGSQPLTVLDEIAWTEGALQNSAGLIVPTGATLSYSGNSTQHKLDSGGKIAVSGTFNLLGSGDLNTGATIANGATVDVLDGGVFDIQGNGNLSDTFFDNFNQVRKGTVNNAGLFTKSAGSGVSSVSDDWIINNLADGELTVSSGTLRLSRNGSGFNNAGLASVSNGVLQVGGGTSTGTFDVGAAGTLRFSTSTSSSIVHVLDGATINNAGAVEIDGRVRFLNGATITSSAALSLVGDDAEISGTSPFELDEFAWNGGTLANSGGVSINAGGTLAIGGSGIKRLANNARLTVAGTATLAGTQSIVNLATPASPAQLEIAPTGVFDLQGDVGLADSPSNPGTNAGTLTIDGVFRKSTGSGVSAISVDWAVQNNGALEVTAGTLRFFGPVANDGGVELAGGNVDFRGNVTGAGDFTGAGLVTFRGDYRPGAGPTQVQFGGDVVLDSSTPNLFVELGGTAPGTGYDQLLIDGAATLAGKLRVSLIDLGSGVFAPQAGDVFDILHADGGITGQFTAMLPTLAPGLVWQVLKSETALSLAVASTVSTLAGDYNLNGVVDVADYTVWRDSFGNTGSALAADGNKDEIVDDQDYQVWKMHFGEVSPNGSASSAANVATIPEASTFALFSLGLLLTGVWRGGR